MKQVKKTEGSEYYTLEGIEYKGYYYINTKNNIAYVYDELNKATKILVPKHTYDTETVRLRSKVKGGTSTPVLYRPEISNYTYTVGKIKRYFVQKRNSPENTIIEIDLAQYNKINSEYSSDAIDRNIYKGIILEWLISGNEDFVKMKNQRTIDELEKNFKGISRYLKNPLEFYKK
jgi:hypothetical protein